MVTPDEEHDHYVKDPRFPCKFGVKCYQKNSAHHEKYKHPPKKRTAPEDPSVAENVSKKPRTGEGQSSTEGSQKVTEKPVVDDVDKAVPVPVGDVATPDNTATPKQSTSTPESFDKKQFIKDKFLVDLPDDFYSFWDFCATLKKDDPCKAFSSVGLVLVGPYDVLSDQFSSGQKRSEDDYLIHWRYYYDPPEFQTIIKGSDATQYHIGYFRDEPSQLPVFLASNHAKTNGEFSCMGENVYAAVNIYLEESKKSCDPFKKMEYSRLQDRLKAHAKELGLDLSAKTDSIQKRNNKILSRTFNKLGLVVPYDKKSQLGYRHLAVTDKELKKLLDRLVEASNVQKAKVMSELQTVLTATSIATDECDFGTGIELGWDILAHGVDFINSTIERFLVTSYKLVERDEFGKIIVAHMKNRKSGSDLSVL